MYKIFVNIWKLISKKRKIQALLIIFLTVLASAAELFTLSSFIIMLNFIINPNNQLNLSFNNFDIFTPLYNLMDNNSSMIFGAFIFFVLISGFFRLFLLWSTLKYSFVTGSDFAKTIYFNTLKQPLEYHLKTSSNEILNSLTKKVYLICFEILIPLIIFSSHIIIISSVTIFIIFIMGIFNTLLMLSVISTLYLFMWMYSRKIISRNSFLISKETDKLVTFIQESFSIISLILLRNIQSKFSKEFDIMNRGIKMAEGTNLFFAQGTRIFIETVFLILIAVTSIFAIRNTNINSILPLIGAFGLASLRILPLVQRVYQGYITVRGAYHSFFDLLEYLNLPLHLEDKVKDNQKIILKNNIKLNNISYKYPNSETYIFKNLSLEIPINKITIIKGPTGSGKSTIISILMGLIIPSKGFISVDNLPIYNHNLNVWQNIISYMPQDTVVLDDSLVKNLNFTSSLDLSNEDIHKFLKLTKLKHFIDIFLKKEDITLGEKGSTISGGEKQRLGLSRTIIENKPILILDEPSSSLDKDTTNYIFSQLKQDLKNKTVIIVTHDPEIFEYADRIIDLQ